MSVCDNWRDAGSDTTAGNQQCIWKSYDEQNDARHREGTEKGAGRVQAMYMFVLGNIIDQAHEWRFPVYLRFVDFEKAFDSMSREGLWKTRKCIESPERLSKPSEVYMTDSSV